MNEKNVQACLGSVEMPSRYLGNEVNSVKKELSEMDLTVALAFPDLYEIGMSHFGMQILYTILNRQENIAAERFFTPASDMEAVLKESSTPLFSLESKTDLARFDIIGFSLLYELNFTNILTMLSLADIPFYAEERDETYPLIIGGGPCAFNPEPLADFFDIFVVGDGEDAILEISEAFIQWKKGGDNTRQTLLRELSKISGVYVPWFFKVDYDDEGIQHLDPLYPDYTAVKKAVVPDLSRVAFPVSPLVPFGKPVHDRLRLEIARGCSRGCRFCQAGMIYRPVRERSVADLRKITETSVAATGYSDISLLSLSTGDYSSLEKLMTSLLSVDAHHCTAVSLPSIRAGRLTPQLMKIIRSVRKTGFTIAPEAGTQRLRDVINKDITEADIFDTVTNAFDLGWRLVKLYFMNGLPTETREDIQGICDLAKRLAALKPGKKAGITVSFATFIPKAHTPFQRCSQITTETSRENLDYLKQNLRHPGIKLKWQNPEMSLLEGVFARGDRRLSRLLVAAWEKGCRLDGWDDKFRFDRWQAAFDETGIDPLFYTSRVRSRDEVLPWAHIQCGVDEAFMEEEYDKALAETITRDCRENACSNCGVCDFETIQPVVFGREESPDFEEGHSAGETRTGDVHYAKLRFYYEKIGKTRFFGHLELANIIKRAIKRAGIHVKYTMGFHPDMKLAFDNPLPVGMESEEEFFTLYADIKTPPDLMVERLNTALQKVMVITRAVPAGRVKQEPDDDQSVYDITLDGITMDPAVVTAFLDQTEHIVEQVNHKGKKRVTDLRKAVVTIETLDSCRLKMVMRKYKDRTIRPGEILTRIFAISQDALRTAEIRKLKTG
ncbi:MAG TPA: TIGR03960 family B12-binding radical SAM protein [Desulfobacteraceae bacterium]|nr:TIGR03960 family B12-binding radical SAM protein [Desulfobacteraceae bacterium]